MTGSAAPTYTVIAGPNGSGKSTLIEWLLREHADIGTFINPDVFAKSIHSATGSADIAAGRVALRLTAEKIANRESFSRESTMAGLEIMRSMKRARNAGFNINVIYVAVPDVETAIERVRLRVALGGHDIPETTQRRRFDKSLTNAGLAARMADRMVVFENPSGGHRLVAQIENGRVHELAAKRSAWVDGVITGLDTRA